MTMNLESIMWGLVLLVFAAVAAMLDDSFEERQPQHAVPPYINCPADYK